MPQQKKKNPLDDLYPTTPTPQPSLNPLDELYPRQQQQSISITSKMH